MSNLYQKVNMFITAVSVGAFDTGKDWEEKGSIKHYNSTQTILLVGEGDFSFATCLSRAFRNARNMIATSLDSNGELIRKYTFAEDNLQVLKDKVCTVLHEVDAHTMSEHAALRYKRFDRIVYNFPHSGLVVLNRRHEFHAVQIERHQDLIRGFLKSAKKLLSYKGEIHITHKTSHPFDKWNVTELAEEAGLTLVNQVEFDKWDYPGYCNKKGEGHGDKCDDTFPVGECSTYMFRSV